MSPRARSKIWRHLLITAAFASSIGLGCRDERPPTTGILGSTFAGGAQDIGFRDADSGVQDQPLRALCEPGQKRCLFENSPAFEACADDGERFERGACGPGQTCREGRCAAFACDAGQPICVGTATRAVCAADARSFQDAQPCPDPGDVCRAGRCLDPCALAEAGNSYIGCDYIARELPNYYRRGAPQTSASPFAIIAANPDPLLDAEVTITARDGLPADIFDSITIEPPDGYEDTLARSISSTILGADLAEPLASPAQGVRVPPRSAAVFLIDHRGTLDEASFRVRSTRPVVAYQFSPYCCNFTASNDASLLLPTYTLGTRYRALGYPTMVDADTGIQLPTYLTIVAAEDDTRVELDAAVELVTLLNGEPVVASDAGDFPLQRGDALRLETSPEAIERAPRNADLSGTEIRADRPVATFSGHLCTYVPQDKAACDHLEEQLLPASTLGKRYLLTPVRERVRSLGVPNEERVYWRLVADEAAEVRFDPPLADLEISPPSNPYSTDCRALLDDDVLRLTEGQTCEFGTLNALSAASSGALSVGGVISGHQSTGISYYGSQAGDPGFFLLPPVEQFRKRYSFVVPPTFEKTYAVVALPAGSPLALDTVSVPAQARLALSQVRLDGEPWDIFSVRLEAGFHTMDSARAFGIVAYAFDDYVSFAFPGGLDLVPKGSRP